MFRMAIASLAVVAGGFLFSACPATDPSPPIVSPADVQAAPIAWDSFHLACTVLRAHGCRVDVDGGIPCEEVFSEESQRGVFDLHDGCLARAGTLEEIHRCGTRCPGGR